MVAKEKWAEIPEWLHFNAAAGGRGVGLRYPPLEEDPLFNDIGDPALFPITPSNGLTQGRGAVIVVPGGNYEFLGNHEAEPVAQCLANNLCINAYVLKYRLLPWFGLEEMQQDFYAAVREVRLRCGGPVLALGFSAGGHLVASACAESAAQDSRPDAVALVYTQIDPNEWKQADTACFWHSDVESAQVKSCLVGREKLLPGPGFVAPPPLFVMSSTGDNVCPPQIHTDPYVKAAEDSGVKVSMLRGDFGDHGFGLQDFWAAPCVAWAKRNGFGPA